MVDDLVISKKPGGLNMIDQINSHNANVFVGKLGDLLYKAIDQPLGMALNWGRLGLYGQFILKLHVAV